jgi:hypothetical protein
MEGLMNTVAHNEQVKLTATYLSNMGIAVLVGCAITPLFSPVITTLKEFAICFAGGIVLSALLHVIARHQLNKMKE